MSVASTPYDPGRTRAGAGLGRGWGGAGVVGRADGADVCFGCAARRAGETRTRQPCGAVRRQVTLALVLRAELPSVT
jgi:hypothetical protein